MCCVPGDMRPTPTSSSLLKSSEAAILAYLVPYNKYSLRVHTHACQIHQAFIIPLRNADAGSSASESILELLQATKT